MKASLSEIHVHARVMVNNGAGETCQVYIKLKEPVLQYRLFQLLLRRRREITYEGNFITINPKPAGRMPYILQTITPRYL